MKKTETHSQFILFLGRIESSSFAYCEVTQDDKSKTWSKASAIVFYDQLLFTRQQIGSVYPCEYENGSIKFNSKALAKTYCYTTGDDELKELIREYKAQAYTFEQQAKRKKQLKDDLNFKTMTLGDLAEMYKKVRFDRKRFILAEVIRILTSL